VSGARSSFVGGGLDLRPIPPDRLRECEEVFRETLGPQLGFEDVDVVPGWMMLTVVLNGGLALGAFIDDELAGFSYAFPGYDGRDVYLYSSGLVVRSRHESRGIGRALKLAQRDLALAQGYRRIRWTTGSLASRPLYLYLAHLGAIVVGISPELFAPFRPSSVADEVHIEWQLDPGPFEAHAHASSSARREQPPRIVTTTRPVGPGLRTIMDVRAEPPVDDRYGLELPWDLGLLERQEPEAARQWRLAVRHILTELLSREYQGVDVILDRAQKRSYLVLARERSGRPRVARR
jgi:predicted GNAT superfamily acetyltransferase